LKAILSASWTSEISVWQRSEVQKHLGRLHRVYLGESTLGDLKVSLKGSRWLFQEARSVSPGSRSIRLARTGSDVGYGDEMCMASLLSSTCVEMLLGRHLFIS
jgi:hypothetical protein